MGYAVSERKNKMKCTIQGCPGHYEPNFIIHTIQHGANVLVFENVPAEICDVCSDTILAPDTIRHLEHLMERQTKPARHAPVFAYA